MISICTKNIEGIWFGVAHKGEEILATTFAYSKEKAMKSLLSSIPSVEANAQHSEKTSTFAELVLDSLKAMYDGKDVSHKFSLATKHLSGYTQRILQTVSLIPVGYAASYGSIAKTAGGSPRAVGRVMATNPYAPLVPCHRVVRSDLSLGGYGGGLEAKREFLKRERRGYTEKQEILISGKKLPVFPVEFVLSKKGKF